jgi:glucokinase
MADAIVSETRLGIDIGGTKIAGGIVTVDRGAVLLSERVPTVAHEGGTTVRDRAISLAKRLYLSAQAQGLPLPTAIGVGAGGQIDPQTGVVLSATDVLPGWAGIRLKEAFESALQLPTFVDNDVNALAVGEGRFGAGQAYSTVVFVALGTGVGGAALLQGQLYRSLTGVSAELGHLILQPDGLPCTCGGQGCWEQYVSGPALWRRYAESGGVPIVPDTLIEVTSQDPEGVAGRTVRAVGSDLGIGLVSLANIFGPDLFIIGGGLADLGEFLLAPARTILQARALLAVRSTPIVTAHLGREASIIGAATLAMPDLVP